MDPITKALLEMKNPKAKEAPKQEITEEVVETKFEDIEDILAENFRQLDEATDTSYDIDTYLKVYEMMAKNVRKLLKTDLLKQVSAETLKRRLEWNEKRPDEWESPEEIRNFFKNTKWKISIWNNLPTSSSFRPESNVNLYSADRLPKSGSKAYVYANFTNGKLSSLRVEIS